MSRKFLKADEFLNPGRVRPTHWIERGKVEYLKFLNSSRGVSRACGESPSHHSLIEELRNLSNLYYYSLYQSLNANRIDLNRFEGFEESPSPAALAFLPRTLAQLAPATGPPLTAVHLQRRFTHASRRTS
ncbi:MAG: hypothetical protein HY245_11765 [Rhizobiales bacterium]|nr:hypothetical protein [Hyphomicrobiales bacterium]